MYSISRAYFKQEEDEIDEEEDENPLRLRKAHLVGVLPLAGASRLGNARWEWAHEKHRRDSPRFMWDDCPLGDLDAFF